MKLESGLYVTATPIGNLADITHRAVSVLGAADLILAEDTRVSGKLLRHFMIKTEMKALHDHNEEQMIKPVLGRLAYGQAIALISDAGTPLISDPGYKLVSEVRAAGIPVWTVPGPSALTAALSISGLPTDRFLFCGFLPNKKVARQKALLRDAEIDSTLVYYESARRINAAIADMGQIFGLDRKISICRELTKVHEEIISGDIKEVQAILDRHTSLKGECVIVVGPPGKKNTSKKDIQSRLKNILADHRTKDAVKIIAAETGLPQRELYKMALDMQSDDT